LTKNIKSDILYKLCIVVYYSWSLQSRHLVHRVFLAAYVEFFLIVRVRALIIVAHTILLLDGPILPLSKVVVFIINLLEDA
jgi:hypothetical protein